MRTNPRANPRVNPRVNPRLEPKDELRSSATKPSSAAESLIRPNLARFAALLAVLTAVAVSSGTTALAAPKPDVYSAQEPGLQLVVRTETAPEITERGADPGKAKQDATARPRVVFELAEKAEYLGQPKVLRRLGTRAYTPEELAQLARDVDSNAGRWHAGSIVSGVVAVVGVVGAAACFYTGVGAPLGVWILSGVAVAGTGASYGSESHGQANGVLVRTISDDVIRDRDVYIQDETLTHFAESLERVLGWLK